MLRNYIHKLYFEKLCDNNIYTMPRLNSISLSFSHKDKDIVLLAAFALYVITKVKPKLVYNILSKRRSRSELIGCTVVLENRNAINFYNYLNLFVFPNISDLSSCFMKGSSNLFSWGIVLDNFMVFPELSREVDKFYGLKKLSINFNFKNNGDNFIYNTLNNYPVN